MQKPKKKLQKNQKKNTNTKIYEKKNKTCNKSHVFLSQSHHNKRKKPKKKMQNGKPKKSRKTEHVLLFVNNYDFLHRFEMETYKLKY